MLVSVLPWLVNRIVFVLAVLLRPEFAMGYVAFIALALTVFTALSVLFVAACFVTLLSSPSMGDQGVLVVFIVLIAAGLLGLGGTAIYFAIYFFQRWRSAQQSNLH